jgi:hypothetical protein
MSSVYKIGAEEIMGQGSCPAELFLSFGQQVAEPVQPSFPQGASLADPSLGRGEATRLDAAGAYPSYLLGAYQAAFFQHLQMLNNCSQRDGKGRG